jgi:hypothetical protein
MRTVRVEWILILALAAVLGVPGRAMAADAGWPERGEEVKSMGFHSKYKPYFGAMLKWDRREGASRGGGELLLGVYRDLGNPNTGIGITGEVYGTSIETDLDGGLRAFVSIKTLLLSFGADYSLRDDRMRFIWGIQVPIWRKGPIQRGGDYRLDIVSGKPRRSYNLGIITPLGQPYMAKTRPRLAHVSLPPKPGRTFEKPFEPSAELESTLNDLSRSADAISDFTTPFLDRKMGSEEDDLRKFRGDLDRFREAYYATDEDFPRGHTFDAEIRFYHSSLTRAFRLAVGDESTGAAVATRAKAILFDEVVLPYNRLLGQWKANDSLFGLGTRAQEAFRVYLEGVAGLSGDEKKAAEYVFRRLIEIMEENRERERETWQTPRVVWLPLHYVLALEDHDTQGEVDAILERFIEHELTTGNDIHYIVSEQFQWELYRMIHEARDYHVLWIHDYKGVNAAGAPDSIGYVMTTDGYMRALINSVRRFDETGKIPTYIIILDEFYYAVNDGELWLRLLADPLDYRMSLPKGFEDWEENIRGLQQELRTAVAESGELQNGLKVYGRDWLYNKVKVHVNITNPSDLSFRASHLFDYFPYAPDNVMRDHRKISFYDITEADPGRGESMFTGMGVGEHYAGPTWDDRALLVRGPAALHTKEAAREVLLTQSFKPAEIPACLRPIRKPDNYDEMVQALVAKGWRHRAMQGHSPTGYFGPKNANLIKAVIYNLMPAGSHMYIPDSLWNSPLWGSMLVGAAFRGCKVLVIAPSLENAPSAGIPQMSRANELFTKFVVIQEQMGEDIAYAGGLFRTGVYDPDIGVGDQIALAEAFQNGIRENPWLLDLMPFHPSVRGVLPELVARLKEEGYEPAYLVKDVENRRPKLHLKVQVFASQEAIDGIVSVEGWRELILGYFEARAEQTSHRDEYVSAKSLRGKLSGDSEVVLKKVTESHTPEELDKMVLYLTLGSHNQNYRSMFMDGEVLYVVADSGTMLAYLDFLVLIGVTTWVESVEELRDLMPAYGGFKEWLGRWIKDAV